MPASTLIAIVDDDSSFRLALEGFVRSLGHRAVGFDSAESFLRSGAAPQANCIISDIHMPGLSGIELKQRLDEQGCEAGFILVSAHDEDHVRRQALASGAMCFLLKPFDPDELAACMARAIGA